MQPLTRLFAALLAVALPFAGASAQTISSITADFANSVPGANTVINNSDPSAIMVCWPVAATTDCGNLGTATNLSGYIFERAITPFSPGIGSPFALGTFTHVNYEVSLGGLGPLTSVDLLFSFTILGATPSSFGDTWTLSHEETDNYAACPYPGGSPCADLVSFAIAGGGAPTPFEYDGVQYVLTLFGFGSSAAEASLNPDFLTFEDQINTTQLWAQITPTSTVPEPATMTLLATGLAGMAAARKRRKS